jgi:hypothetical protein
MAWLGKQGRYIVPSSFGSTQTMAFSDYKTLDQVQRQFQIRYQEGVLLTHSPHPPSAAFCQELHFTLENLDVFTSEAARSEAVIFPILREIYKDFHQHYALWIQKALRYDEHLYGTPDYLLSKRSALGKTVLEAPLLMVVEAKKNDFEQGWAQCLAEMIAAQKINAQQGESPKLYGIVTDGKLWEFAVLEGQQFTRHRESFMVDDLPTLFGFLHGLMSVLT